MKTFIMKFKFLKVGDKFIKNEVIWVKQEKRQFMNNVGNAIRENNPNHDILILEDEKVAKIIHA